MENEEKIGADDPRVAWYADEFEPDDPDEIAEREAKEFRSTEKAEVIRDLLRRGKTAAEIKIYGPDILRRRERDGVRRIEEGQKKRVKRTLGRPIPSGRVRGGRK